MGPGPGRTDGVGKGRSVIVEGKALISVRTGGGAQGLAHVVDVAELVDQTCLLTNLGRKEAAGHQLFEFGWFDFAVRGEPLDEAVLDAADDRSQHAPDGLRHPLPGIGLGALVLLELDEVRLDVQHLQGSLHERDFRCQAVDEEAGSRIHEDLVRGRGQVEFLFRHDIDRQEADDLLPRGPKVVEHLAHFLNLGPGGRGGRNLQIQRGDAIVTGSRIQTPPQVPDIEHLIGKELGPGIGSRQFSNRDTDLYLEDRPRRDRRGGVQQIDQGTADDDGETNRDDDNDQDQPQLPITHEPPPIFVTVRTAFSREAGRSLPAAPVIL